MKKYIMILLTCFLFAFYLFTWGVTDVQAHPGRTDANGGHTCRTNCEKWGLEYGEYHYHNGGSSSSSSSSSNSATVTTVDTSSIEK